jgi:hypothetical protein
MGVTARGYHIGTASVGTTIRVFNVTTTIIIIIIIKIIIAFHTDSHSCLSAHLG